VFGQHGVAVPDEALTVFRLATFAEVQRVWLDC